MAIAINQYLWPIKKELKDPYFVTLTVETVYGKKLRDRISKMGKVWRKIANSAAMRIIDNKARGTIGSNFKGLRKLEVTYNAKDDKYHPHYHIVIEGKENAKYLVKRWVDIWQKEGVKCIWTSQDIRKADEKTLLELFKYSWKPTTKTKDGKDIRIPPKNHDVINQALSRRKTYHPFGGIRRHVITPEEVMTLKREAEKNLKNAVTNEEQDLVDAQDLGKLVAGEKPKGVSDTKFLWKGEDWVGVNTGEMLTGYTPEKDDRDFAEEANTEEAEKTLDKIRQRELKDHQKSPQKKRKERERKYNFKE